MAQKPCQHRSRHMQGHPLSVLFCLQIQSAFAKPYDIRQIGTEIIHSFFHIPLSSHFGDRSKSRKKHASRKKCYTVLSVQKGSGQSKQFDVSRPQHAKPVWQEKKQTHTTHPKQQPAAFFQRRFQSDALRNPPNGSYAKSKQNKFVWNPVPAVIKIACYRQQA